MRVSRAVAGAVCACVLAIHAAGVNAIDNADSVRAGRVPAARRVTFGTSRLVRLLSAVGERKERGSMAIVKRVVESYLGRHVVTAPHARN